MWVWVPVVNKRVWVNTPPPIKDVLKKGAQELESQTEVTGTTVLYLLLQLDKLPPAGSSSSTAETSFSNTRTLTGPQHCQLEKRQR